MLGPMPSRRVQPVVRISSDQRTLRVPRKRITNLVRFLALRERARIVEVDLAVVSARRIASLNRTWLGHRGPTDVISFDLTDPGEDGLWAQLVVCADVAARQGPRHGQSAQRELLLYVTHGLLHLLGYDDQTPANAAGMHARQEQLLAAFYREERAARGG